MNRVSRLLRFARKVGTSIVQWQEIDKRNSCVEGADCFQSLPICAVAPSVTKLCKTANMTADIIRHASLSMFVFNNARTAIDQRPFSQNTVTRLRLKSDHFPMGIDPMPLAGTTLIHPFAYFYEL